MSDIVEAAIIDTETPGATFLPACSDLSGDYGGKTYLEWAWSQLTMMMWQQLSCNDLGDDFGKQASLKWLWSRLMMAVQEPSELWVVLKLS